MFERRDPGIRQQERDVVMVDIVFVVLTLLFFMAAAAYVSACARIE
jgi:biopolymer transport protein ExbD